MMIDLNILSQDMYQDQLKQKLTSSKIRSLYHDIELRKLTIKELDEKVVDLLKRPLIVKSGKDFKLEVESSLLKDHLKAKIKLLGYLTDGSFSSEIIKLSDNAYFSLIEDLISENKQKSFKAELIKAGAIDVSLQGILRHASKHLLAKYTGDAAEKLVAESEKEFTYIVENTFQAKNINNLKKIIPDFFK